MFSSGGPPRSLDPSLFGHPRSRKTLFSAFIPRSRSLSEKPPRSGPREREARRERADRGRKPAPPPAPARATLTHMRSVCTLLPLPWLRLFICDFAEESLTALAKSKRLAA